jgi:hypothetical protein
MAMTSRQALAFIRTHGVVLEGAQGPVPSLVEVIAGEPVRGSWWSHPKSHEIFAVTRAMRASDDVLVCRLIKGKITFVHRRAENPRFNTQMQQTCLTVLCDSRRGA